VKGLILAAIVLTFAGCALFRQELPPWARPVAASTPVVTSDAPESAPSPTPTPAPITEPAEPSTVQEAALPADPPVTPPIGPSPAPESAAAPPVRAPTPPPAPPPILPPPPTSAPARPPAGGGPALTASLPPAEVRRLQDEAQRRIDEAERLLRQLEGRPVPAKDLETLRLAQSLVEQARKALGGQEYERAANLATKARTLADDLSTRR
jgi:hypothetical protein